MLLPSISWHRYKQEKATVQDELFQAVMREREAAMKHLSASLHPGEGSIDQEKRKSALLVSADLPELAFRALTAQGSRGQAWDLIFLKPGLCPPNVLRITSVERVSF